MKHLRINNDINGNPRYVVHFLELLNEDEKNSSFLTWAHLKYELALLRAKTVGGKKYSTKSFGGGVVFQSYDLKNDVLKSFDILENSNDYAKAKNHLELVILNDFAKYKKAIEIMGKCLSGAETASGAFANIYDLCSETADEMRKRFNIRLSRQAIWIGAVLVCMDVEESIKAS